MGNSTRTNRAVVLIGCVLIAIVILFITQRSYETEVIEEKSSAREEPTSSDINKNNQQQENEEGGQRKFPTHWGEPPRLQTRDFRELPGGYGYGSGTLAKWIKQHMDRDEQENHQQEIPEDLAEQPEYLP